MDYLRNLIDSGNIGELFSFSRGSTIFLIGCGLVAACIVTAVIAAFTERRKLRRMRREIMAQYTDEKD